MGTLAEIIIEAAGEIIFGVIDEVINRITCKDYYEQVKSKKAAWRQQKRGRNGN